MPADFEEKASTLLRYHDDQASSSHLEGNRALKLRLIQFLGVGLALHFLSGTCAAQDPPHPPEHQHSETVVGQWSWTTDANLFYGYNYQQRKFADFSA